MFGWWLHRQMVEHHNRGWGWTVEAEEALENMVDYDSLNIFERVHPNDITNTRDHPGIMMGGIFGLAKETSTMTDSDLSCVWKVHHGNTILRKPQSPQSKLRPQHLLRRILPRSPRVNFDLSTCWGEHYLSPPKETLTSALTEELESTLVVSLLKNICKIHIPIYYFVV